MTIKKISVFCGAHLGKSPDYKIAAQQIGKMMAEKDLEVIFGGGNVGLMKIVADTAVDNGGRATGITLKSLHEFELTNPNIDETIITHSLFERKEKFLDMSDAFIVLPGGVGSMDELLEVMVSNQLGGINKPVGLLNINGYYDGFLSWLKHSVDEEFVSIENQNQILVHDDPKELLEMILSAQMPSSDTWIDRLNVDFPKD
ncbi:TIGR00730 family Rossman fold protein [Pseudomonadota bacterium]|nr:TIGR00730 family Rossman fold protein [Pseudomonadota bacterium]